MPDVIFMPGSSGGGTSTLAAIAAAQPYPVGVVELGKFGAKLDLRTVFDAAIVSGTNKLKCATSKPFKAADVGKYVCVNSAGVVALVEKGEPGATKQWNPLCARITNFISAEEVELDTNASHTPAAGAFLRFGSDDTVAVIETIKEVVKKAQESGNGLCAVWFPKMIGVAGELKTDQEGLAQIPLPLVEATSGGGTAQGPKVILHLWGGPEASGVPLWYQHVPQESGGGIFSFGPRKPGEAGLVHANGQPPYQVGVGRPAVIGGPTPEKGWTGLKYPNMLVVIDGLTMSGPCNGTMTDFELNGIAAMNCKSLGSFRLGIPNLVGAVQGEGPNEYVLASAGFEGGFETAIRPATALAEPLAGNNDKTIVGTHSCEGHTSAIELGEHGTHGHIVSVYNFFSATPAKSAWIHATNIDYFSAEACRFGFYTPPMNGAACFVNVKQYDTEVGAGRWTTVGQGWFWDTGNLNKGDWNWGAGEHASEELGPLLKGGTQTKFRNTGISPGKVGALEYKSAVEKTNTLYRDAIVQWKKLTALEVDGQAIPLVGEAATTLIPSGKTYKATGAEGAGTWTVL